MHRSLPLSVVVLALSAPAAVAAHPFSAADIDTTKTGATAPGNPFRYVALRGGGETVLAKIRRAGGAPLVTRRLPGRLVVAAVAQDASTTGLSADGSTLVLSTPRRRVPALVTRLTVIDTGTLAPRRRLVLRGDFTLDGISPDGRRLYLIEYRGRNGNPLDYAVRAYDVPHRRLLPKPIVDARKPDEKMTGFPVARAVSADGRWAYTLYAGGEEQFVHALDTARSRAFCVDLDGLTPEDVNGMRLAARHGRVDLLSQSGGVVRRIDATTFKVTTPRTAAAPATPQVKDEPPSDGFPWGLAAAVGAIAAAAAFLLRRRYAAGTDSAASRAASSSTPTVP